MFLIKKVVFKFRNVISFFYLNIVSVNECLSCRRQIFSLFPLCTNCERKLFIKPLAKKIVNSSSFLSLSYKEFVLEKEDNIFFSDKLQARENKDTCNFEFLIRKTYLLYPYVGKYIDIVLYWKNANMRGFSNLFAYLIARFIKKMPSLLGVPIVPIPPRPAKLKTKGWDQIEDICGILEILYSFKVERILARRDGHSQKGLSKANREKNLVDKIYMRRKTKIPKKVILLDDVITTGSTIKLCTSVLCQAGIEEVFPLLLFCN